MDDGSARVKTWMFFSGHAPARGLFFLLLFLWTSKEKVDAKHKNDQYSNQNNNLDKNQRFCVTTLWQRRDKKKTPRSGKSEPLFLC